MRTKFVALALIGVLWTAASFEARAFPSLPNRIEPASAVTLAAGGCGPGWHRGPWGGCRRNWGPYGRRCWFTPTPYGPRRVCRW